MSIVKRTKMDKMQGKRLPLLGAQRNLEELEAQMAASPAAQTPEVEAILEDLRGQVSEPQ